MENIGSLSIRLITRAASFSAMALIPRKVEGVWMTVVVWNFASTSWEHSRKAAMTWLKHCPAMDLNLNVYDSKLVELYVEYNIVAICDDNLISSSHYHLDLSASDWHRSAVSTEYSGSQWLPVLDCIRMNVRGRMQQDMSQERFGQLHQQYNLLMCRVATINFWIHLAPSERTLITAPGGWWHLSGRNMQQRIIKANRIAVRVAARKDKSSAVGRHCAIFASIAPKQS